MKKLISMICCVLALTLCLTACGQSAASNEGKRRQITLEIEPGSSLPNDAFLDDVIADIRDAVNRHNWSTPLVVEGESDFGISDYIDTDYGVDNDGVTDYEGESAYDATTDYDDTDYGPNNDGVTDYDDTDYGPNNDGVTDYSDYGTTDGQL